MIEAFLSKLIINERNDQHLMILKEKDGNRILPIVISIFEAISIDRVLRKMEVPRPLTHDLMNIIFVKLGADLDFVEIADLNQGTYFANLHFSSPDNRKVVVDCRPSDSIALAVRAKCPIMIRRKVLELATKSMTPNRCNMSEKFGSFAKGRYTIIRKLGSGFTSEVFLAIDEANDVKVAVKLADSRTASDANLVRRFEQEILLLERFSHRNLVKHLNHGFQDGKPYLVMEYVKGLTLSEWLKSNESIKDIAYLLLQLLEALKYIHSNGVVHRDLKPANIIVIKAMSGNHLKIIDFGFARWLNSTERITMTGEIVGSPVYMAPEQIKGSDKIDNRCDFFAFGIIAFEAFTGRLPFIAPTPSETAYKIFSEPPSDFSESRPDLPKHLGDLINKCLKKQSYQRPHTADAIIKELTAIIEKLS